MQNEEPAVSPARLLEIAFGYQRSQTLFALVELKIPTLLAAKPLALAEISDKVAVHPLALDRLLNAAVALGVLRRLDDQTFQNSELADKFLIEDAPFYLGEQFLLYRDASYQNWLKLPAKLRAWQPGASDAQTPQEEDQGADSMAAQHNLALLVGRKLARAYDFSRHENMLDLGGGTGGMSLGICALHRSLKAMVFDLPEIIEKAEEFIREAGLSAQIETKAGNFKEDDLPENFDCVLLANLLSVSSEETNQKLFREIYELLPAGGVCLISGWILDDSRTSPEIAVLFCLEDIIWQVPDVERTETTYRRWLEAAGFKNIRRETFLAPYSLMIAQKD